MRFGKSAKEAKEEPGKGGSGGDFMRYIKDGDQTFRIMQEPDDWTYYWEHYNPMGFSFPCNDTDPDNPAPESCPGCSSDVEKMKRPSRRIAFNVLQSYNGQDYVNVYKVGTMVSDKLENRYARFGTVCDRDYTITRYKTTGDRYDFDVEGGVPTAVDFTPYQLKDIEAMLMDAWNESWGDSPRAPEPRQEAAAAPASTQSAQLPKRPTIAPTPAAEPVQDPPPSEPEPVYQESVLRAMDYDDLVLLVKRDMNGGEVPSELTDSDAVVDWLMQGS